MDVLKHLSGDFVQGHRDQISSPQVAPSNSVHLMSELLTLSVRLSPAAYQRNFIRLLVSRDLVILVTTQSS